VAWLPIASVIWLLLSIWGTSAATAQDAQSTVRSGPDVRLLVLDIEIQGDLGEQGRDAEREKRLRAASDRLREEIEKRGIYDVVDNAPEQALIDRLRSQQFLHRCNGCELDIARRLDADQVLVAWVNRMSNLILTFEYEIRDVKTGQPLLRGALDFRGDNDTAWNRTISYMARDLQERLTAAAP
jgi:hypothetical protein